MAIREEKEIEGIQWIREVKLSLSADDTIHRKSKKCHQKNIGAHQ